jgi:hypothetical protein
MRPSDFTPPDASGTCACKNAACPSHQAIGRVACHEGERFVCGFCKRAGAWLWGDDVARWLAWLGIVKVDGCNCDARQLGLNAIGVRVQGELDRVRRLLYLAFVDVWFDN